MCQRRPLGLKLLFECSTQSIEYHAECLKIHLEPTLARYVCGAGYKGHPKRPLEEAHEWITDPEVLEEHVVWYPHSIELSCNLKHSDELIEGIYVYLPSSKEAD